MTDYDHSFTSFIDHYILLLAARFRAPLDARTICGSDADPVDLEESWGQVARCVRDALSHPQTAQEREELKYLDVEFFTADICRERALYFQWQLQQKTVESTAPADEPQQRQTTRKRRPRRANAVDGPSSFDITKDSVQAAVENIYAAARARLPSTRDSARGKAPGAEREGEGEKDKESEGESDGDGESEVAVAEFPSRTEEAEAMDFAVAEARDALLTKVQSLQAEFFAQHRRWVDVPLDLDTPPRAAATAEPGGRASAGENGRTNAEANGRTNAEANGRTNAEANGRTNTEANGRTNAEANGRTNAEANGRTNAEANGRTNTEANESADALPLRAFEALRRGVMMDRPPRPSQMREEDYVLNPDDLQGFGSEVDAALRQTVRTADRNAHQVVMPAEVGVHNGSRPNRWSVMEYEDEDSDDSDIMD